jgi:hypothetical protein
MMGQAKQRGTYEQRRAEALAARKVTPAPEQERRAVVNSPRYSPVRAHSLMALAAGIVAATKGGKYG